MTDVKLLFNNTNTRNHSTVDKQKIDDSKFVLNRNTWNH